MKYLFEVIKLVDAGMKSDRETVVAYAQQLASRLESDGELKAAKGIINAISKAPFGRTVELANVNNKLPLDSESRLSLADVEVWSPGSILLSLPATTAELIRSFVKFVQQRDKLLAHDLNFCPSLLMYGPPGCGKTELARQLSADLGLPLIIARTDALISSYLGSTAKNIRSLFDYAARTPSVLFLDEFDALAKMRDDRHELGELKRVVISLLQNIDGYLGNNVLLAATNHEHLLDPAVWRRFTYRVEIGKPEVEQRAELFRRFTAGFDLDEVLLDTLVAISEGLSGADIRQVSEHSKRVALLGEAPLDTQELMTDILRRVCPLAVSEEHSLSDRISILKKSFPRIKTSRQLGQLLGVSHVTIQTHDKEGQRAREQGTSTTKSSNRRTR